MAYDTSLVEFGPNYTLVLVPDEFAEDTLGTEPIVLYSTDFEEGPSLDREINAPAAWSVTVPWEPSFEDWVLQDAYLYFGGELLMQGELHAALSEHGSQTTTLEGEGVLFTLRRGGVQDSYNNITGANAVQSYISDHVDGWDFTITELPPSNIDVDVEVQSASLDNGFNRDAGDDIESGNKPLWVQHGGVNLLQHCWPMEGEHFDRGNVADDTNWNWDPDTKSNGDLIILSNDDAAGDGEHNYAEWDFEVEHTIPSIFVGVKFRAAAEEQDGAPAFEWYIVDGDGNETTFGQNREVGAEFSYSWWETGTGEDPRLAGGPYDGGDIEPGDCTLGVRVTDSHGDTDTHALFIDIVAPYDTRYIPNDWNDDWNTVHEDEGYFDGPPLAGPVNVNFIPHDDAFNVIGGRATAEMDNTSGDQRLQLSNDGGDTWHPDGSLGENTETVRVEFDTVGTELRGRVRLDAYSGSGAQDATPRFGYDLQAVTRWRLQVSTNTRMVIDELDVEGSHLDNIKALCEAADLAFVADYADTDDPHLDVFSPGAIAGTLDVKVEDWSREVDGKDYANRIQGFGETDDGNRIQHTWLDPGERDDHGEVRAPPEFHPNATTRARLRTLGRPRLRAATSELDLRGTLDIIPTNVKPGYGYTHPHFDGQVLTLRRVSFSDTDSPSGTLDFRPPTEFIETLRGVSRRIQQVERS